MKCFTLFPILATLLVLTTANPIANPFPDALAEPLAEAIAEPITNPDAIAENHADLQARTTCKIARRFRPDLHGVCVDTRTANSCTGGTLYPGHCPGANWIICCVN